MIGRRVRVRLLPDLARRKVRRHAGPDVVPVRTGSYARLAKTEKWTEVTWSSVRSLNARQHCTLLLGALPCASRLCVFRK